MANENKTNKKTAEKMKVFCLRAWCKDLNGDKYFTREIPVNTKASCKYCNTIMMTEKEVNQLKEAQEKKRLLAARELDGEG